MLSNRICVEEDTNMSRPTCSRPTCSAFTGILTTSTSQPWHQQPILRWHPSSLRVSHNVMQCLYTVLTTIVTIHLEKRSAACHHRTSFLYTPIPTTLQLQYYGVQLLPRPPSLFAFAVLTRQTVSVGTGSASFLYKDLC